jgi:hypothetical protein
MTGLDNNNFPAFNAAARYLRQHNYSVANPATKGIIDGWTWTDYLKTDLQQLLRCDSIYMLRGWRKSKGARLEYYVAKALGYTILFEGRDCL